MTVRTLTLSACLLPILTAAPLPSGQNFGAVCAAGNQTVTQSTLDADKVIPLTTLLAAIGGDLAGWFSSLDETTISIDGLRHAEKPARLDSGADVSGGFDANPVMPALGIDCIFDGIYPASWCSASPSDMLQTCTPGLLMAPSDSPLSFVSDPASACIPPIQTTATWLLAGATRHRPFQTPSILPAKASMAGMFAAIITATPKSEPEGAYMLGSGLGLILLSIGSRRLFGKRQMK
jgi:hypothetical protein